MRAATYSILSFCAALALVLPCYGQRDVRFALTRNALRDTTGSQDITVSGLGTVRGAAIWSSFTGLNETPNPQALWSFGAGTSSTKRLALATRFADTAFSNVGGHFGVSDRIWTRIAPSSNSVLEDADVGSMIPDGVRLNATVASASGSLLTSLLVAGADARSAVTRVTTSPVIGGTADVAIPFEPTCGILFTSTDDFDAQTGHNGYATQAMAFFTNDKAGNVSHVGQSIAWRMPSFTPSSAYGQVSTAGLPVIDPTMNISAVDGMYTVSFPTPTTLRVTSVDPTNDASPAQIGALLFDTAGLRAQVGVLSLPTSSGTLTLGPEHFMPDVPFVPQALLAGVNRLTEVDTFSGNSASAGVWGMAGVTRPDGVPAGEAEFSTTVASRVGLLPSDTESLSSDRFLYIQPHDGTTNGRVLVDFNHFVSGGMNVNIVEAPSAAFQLPYLAIESALSPFAGDYNNDGTVDAADFLVWRANEGTMASLPNDPLGGVIGQGQLEQWQENFGRTVASAAGSAALSSSPWNRPTVPEPNTDLLLVAAATVGFFSRFSTGLLAFSRLASHSVKSRRR
jgi:hypothetical protein